jgi:hypothetical protein
MLLSFSRGAWFNMGMAVVIYGALHILTVRSHRARLKFMTLALAGIAGIAGMVVLALQLDAVSNLASERASLSQRYDQGPEGRFGGQEKAASLALANPLGIGAQQFVPQHHHEEPHNVYVTMFLNAGWLGAIIDLDHWRHFYLLLALAWGLMLSRDKAGVGPPAANLAYIPKRPARV